MGGLGEVGKEGFPKERSERTRGKLNKGISSLEESVLPQKPTQMTADIGP